MKKISRIILDCQIQNKVKKMQKLVGSFTHTISNKISIKSTIKPISGTFICPRPPDYKGVNAEKWSKEDWRNEFQRLKRIGIDVAILQSSITEITTGDWFIYYPITETARSKIKTIDERLKKPPKIIPHVLPAILDAANEVKMKIHVGLFNCIKGWFGKSSSNLVTEIKNEEMIIAKDLIDLYGKHPAVAGWYISPEIMYFLHGKKLKLNMNEFLRNISKILNSNELKLPIGISPGSTLPKGNQEPVLEFWYKTLNNSGIDILYPQDAVGQLVNFPDKFLELWNFWNNIACKTNKKLWANCENFERKSFDPIDPFEAASFDRLKLQLISATPYVDKIISWECMYFLNKKGAKNGKTLFEEYNNFFKY